MAQVSGKIYVGGELVGLVDVGTVDQLRADAQKLANAWPDETTVLVSNLVGRQVIKPRKGVVRLVFAAAPVRKSHVETPVQPMRKAR